MNAKHWNGEPGAEHDPGRSDGQPVAYRCLECPWRDHGVLLSTAHVQATGHRVVSKGDPRYDTAPIRKAGAA